VVIVRGEKGRAVDLEGILSLMVVAVIAAVNGGDASRDGPVLCCCGGGIRFGVGGGDRRANDGI